VVVRVDDRARRLRRGRLFGRHRWKRRRAVSRRYVASFFFFWIFGVFFFLLDLFLDLFWSQNGSTNMK
jgi:hypothetical protein